MHPLNIFEIIGELETNHFRHLMCFTSIRIEN